MKFRLVSRLTLLLVVLSLVTNSVPAQSTTTGRLTGTVTDAQGALIGGAQIVAKNTQTQAEFKAKANDDGGWTIPSMPNGVYLVTVTAQGFKSTVVQNVAVETGSAATVNTALEVGATNETVTVTSGGSVIQTESTNISSTITGRQIGELPWATRDAMQLVLTLPGIQTPGTPRTSSVNGLPKSSLNITLDGANIQDNFLKSSDGFFTSTQAKSDAVEEVTVSTATPGAESGGEGAVQIKFVTKSGSNNYRGGVFWQHRNTALNANYYFNNIDGLRRDHLILNQYGGNVGGPIWIPKVFKGKDKAFFFVNMEEFKLPQTYNGARTVLTDSARRGIFTYKDSAGAIRTVNLFEIAGRGAGGRTYTNTPDPTITQTLDLINAAAQKGVLRSRTTTADDYNRLDLTFQDPGRNIRRFPTVRLDFNLTNNHHLEFVHNYQHYFSDPDGVNGQINQYPGTGIVVGSPGITGSIYRNNFTFAAAERWTISNRLVNEVRATSSGNGTSVFTREFAPGLYSLFGGYAVNTSFGSAFFSRSTQSRRNTPLKTINDNLNYIKGSHTLNFGVAFTQVKSFTQDVGRQTVPSVTLGIATGDPINNGSTSIFAAPTSTNPGNFPGSNTTQRSDAALLYALLTGRVSSTTKSVTLDENDRDFQAIPITARNHQNEWGLYVQDSWKVKPNLTLNYGLRWEFQPSPINDNLVYTRVGIDGLFGVSGVGNLFKPGVFENPVATQYRLLDKGEKGYKNDYKNFAPSLGFAWTPEFKTGLMSKVFGDSGQTVIRGGYSIAYVREGFNTFTTMFGANNGPSVQIGTNPSDFPTEFGAPGSRLLRDGNYPFLAIPTPTFPFTARQGDSLNDFNPNLDVGYVQSYSFGIQRELNKDTALEIRYVGNHAVKLWQQYELNEVNIFENGFLTEFKAAQNNLAISRAAGRGNNYGNQGLPGQVNVPIIQNGISATGATTDSTTVTRLDRGEAGAVANAIAADVTRMNRLIGNNLVPSITLTDPNDPTKTIRLSNYFIANPRSPGGAFLMDNGSGTTYNALQVELRRRMANGLLVQGSYVWSKSMANAFASDATAFSQPTTLRNFQYDKGPAPRDVRHQFKVDWIHELPVGRGHKFMGGNIPVISTLLEGWQWGGVARIQSGTPFMLTSGRRTYNNREPGVVLHNISTKQLQELVKIRKETVCDPTCRGVVYFLPQEIINNTLAAFETGGKTLANLNNATPYIGPPTEAGKLGNRVFLYGPWQARFDLNLMKRTRISERTDFEFRVQFLNAFNRPNFTIQGAGDNVGTGGIGAAFGQTRNAYRDITVSGTNDPGGRLVEFQLRLNFR
jgi:hypothetical protein